MITNCLLPKAADYYNQVIFRPSFFGSSRLREQRGMLRWSRWMSSLGNRLVSLMGRMRRPSRVARQAAQFELARKEFHQRREWLEAKFFELASGSGKPRG